MDDEQFQEWLRKYGEMLESQRPPQGRYRPPHEPSPLEKAYLEQRKRFEDLERSKNYRDEGFSRRRENETD
jgi:hypothetical protein